MLAGTAKIDITPPGPVWMDGMLRSHTSEGIHDTLYARALVVCNGRETRDAFALVSVDVCILDEETTLAVREGAEARTGIPARHVIVAATHTHSGPSAFGIFTPREDAYVQELARRLVNLIADAMAAIEPVTVGTGSGRERTISHYRRLLADDGHVVMNWEPFPVERIVGPLGKADTEVGVIKFLSTQDPPQTVAIAFNHAGHPNILSGDNYQLSADYPGLAAGLLEVGTGGTALYFNGAEGSVDIDGLRDRDWDGWERAGHALAQCVADTAAAIIPQPAAAVWGESCRYTLPGRHITDAEWRWSQEVITRTGGKVQPMSDGIGDDYKALFFKRLREREPRDIPVEQICIALGDCALLSFPGELYTEIGQQIKSASPFARTCIIGLANGYVGYVPTAEAITKGGYAEDTRWVEATAENTVIKKSLALLRKVHATTARKGVHS